MWRKGEILFRTSTKPVSYTHLDVYKRQQYNRDLFAGVLSRQKVNIRSNQKLINMGSKEKFLYPFID